MKIFKKVVSLVLCLILCTFMLPAISAANDTKIILTHESAMPGKEVTVDISITGNPGIMAMTFSVVYDKDQFEYISFSKGFISTPQYKDHPDKGYVTFSVCEASNKLNNGNILSVSFKIKKDATPGKYPITIGNHNYEDKGKKIDNCFANSSEKYIVPTVSAGSIRVESDCDKLGHDFGGWSTKTKPTCQVNGVDIRVCDRCGMVEEKSTSVDHDFEDEWTVDKAATPDETGIMSRHCKNCNEVTDMISFTYEEVGGDGGDTSSEGSSSEDASEDNSSSDDASNIDSENSSESSNEEGSSDNNTTSENTSSVPPSNKKPPINNTVGSKNPLSAVEGLKDYQEIIKPNVSKPTDNITESDENTTGTNSDKNEDEKKGNDKPFFKTVLGVIIAILGGLLSIGILALGVVLIIIRNKKEEQQ